MAFLLGIPIKKSFHLMGQTILLVNFRLQENAKQSIKSCHPHLLYLKTHFSVSMKTSKVLASNYYSQNFWLNLPKGINFPVFPTVLIKSIHYIPTHLIL